MQFPFLQNLRAQKLYILYMIHIVVLVALFKLAYFKAYFYFILDVINPLFVAENVYFLVALPNKIKMTRRNKKASLPLTTVSI